MNTTSHAFQYDPFQAEAIRHIDEGHSLFVAAPTGAGKTVIAEYAIEHALAKHEGAIYTAPVKALSNQKYRDFSARYGDQIGIVTGDVSINPSAPILIMTTEIYRNTLFENVDRLQRVAWVIFDEVHYLDDPERGTVWEESLIFSPDNVQLLCLSATIPNVDELASWIRSIHHRTIEVVVETHRPVPLTHLFQCQGAVLPDLLDLRRQGYQGRDNWRERHPRRRQHHSHKRLHPNRLDSLMRHVIKHDRLPCIFFAFGRRRTEDLALELSDLDLMSSNERQEVLQLFDRLCHRYQLDAEPSAMATRQLVARGVAFHHAGMLPTLKEVVEQVFTSRLIKLIFTTETFALGINMPARTVVFDELRKRTDRGFRSLRRREYFQMAGRAGRRGMDEVGYVYSRINPRRIPYGDVSKIITGQPEPVRSQLNTSYATLLNLYQSYGWGLLDLYQESFHSFQSPRRQRDECRALMERKLTLLDELDYLDTETLTPKGVFTAQMYGYELLLGELHADWVLDDLQDVPLLVLLSALVFEPRRREGPAKPPKRLRQLATACRDTLEHLHRAERHHRIAPRTKPAYFHLAPAMEAWANGQTFDRTLEVCEADEGELVRYFRMVIQLLRQIRYASGSSEQLRETATRAVERINRDVVDAERQLRASDDD